MEPFRSRRLLVLWRWLISLGMLPAKGVVFGAASGTSLVSYVSDVVGPEGAASSGIHRPGREFIGNGQQTLNDPNY